jgi:hypothetical protein
MGLFKKMKSLSGAPDKDLLRNGLLGQGIITEVKGTNVSVGEDAFAERVCLVTMEISLDDTDRYTATCRQRIPQTALAQIVPGNTTVAVRVSQQDPQAVAIDWSVPPPTVRMRAGGANTGSAADILANGKPCRVVIVQSQDLNRLSATGVPMYAFVFTVIIEGKAPYQTQVGNPVPPEAVPLLFPGSNVPAKYLPDSDEHNVVVDWAAALTEFEKK